MECFQSVVVAFRECCGFQPVCNEWDENCVVDSQLPFQCEVCVAPELV